MGSGCPGEFWVVGGVGRVGDGFWAGVDGSPHDSWCGGGVGWLFWVVVVDFQDGGGGGGVLPVELSSILVLPQSSSISGYILFLVLPFCVTTSSPDLFLEGDRTRPLVMSIPFLISCVLLVVILLLSQLLTSFSPSS